MLLHSTLTQDKGCTMPSKTLQRGTFPTLVGARGQCWKHLSGARGKMKIQSVGKKYPIQSVGKKYWLLCVGPRRATPLLFGSGREDTLAGLASTSCHPPHSRQSLRLVFTKPEHGFMKRWFQYVKAHNEVLALPHPAVVWGYSPSQELLKAQR